jgi:ribonuclease HI
MGYTPIMNREHEEAGSGEFWPAAPVESRGAITAYCDGGSRGNPGPAGFGVHIENEKGESIGALSEYLGKKTNNFAEYSGLLAALNFALEQGHSRLKVVSDSELMVKQIKGQYRVNSPELRPLYEEAKRRIARLDSFQIQHVLREKNRQADRLANEAMDRGMGRSPAAPNSETRGPEIRGPEESQVLRGFVKGGVVHFLEGELPDGVFVRITRERG